MSVRKNAPYADEWDKATNTLIYEGHDAPSNLAKEPKEVDQPLTTPKGTLTENGKFFTAAQSYKMRLSEEPHKIKVYEKIKDGIWCYKGFFNLVDAKIVNTGVRNVFKFYLSPVQFITKRKEISLPHSRLIPTTVKLEVWARDKGQCVLCGSKENFILITIFLSQKVEHLLLQKMLKYFVQSTTSESPIRFYLPADFLFVDSGICLFRLRRAHKNFIRTFAR